MEVIWEGNGSRGEGVSGKWNLCGLTRAFGYVWGTSCLYCLVLVYPEDLFPRNVIAFSNCINHMKFPFECQAN